MDFALCHPPDRPAIFVEVKRVGQAQGADRQLFEYAFHQGVPIAILTDGQEWHLYLPAGQGHYDDRRVYKLDLLEREPDESESRFGRYLGYSAVCSGSALESATADYRDVNRDRQIREALPRAWQELLKEPDDFLAEFLADKVEDVCGYKPDVDSCSQFIRSITGSRPLPPVVAPGGGWAGGKAPAPSGPRPGTGLGGIGFALFGQFHPCGAAREVMIRVLQEFDRHDGAFLERFVSRKHGRKRRYVATDRQDLYPGRPDLAEVHYAELKPGWYVGTNYSRQVIETIIRLACDVASVSFGSDIQVDLG